MKSSTSGVLCKLDLEKAYNHNIGLFCSTFWKDEDLGRNGKLGYIVFVSLQLDFQFLLMESHVVSLTAWGDHVKMILCHHCYLSSWWSNWVSCRTEQWRGSTLLVWRWVVKIMVYWWFPPFICRWYLDFCGDDPERLQNLRWVLLCFKDIYKDHDIKFAFVFSFTFSNSFKCCSTYWEAAKGSYMGWVRTWERRLNSFFSIKGRFLNRFNMEDWA